MEKIQIGMGALQHTGEFRPVLSVGHIDYNAKDRPYLPIG